MSASRYSRRRRAGSACSVKMARGVIVPVRTMGMKLLLGMQTQIAGAVAHRYDRADGGRSRRALPRRRCLVPALLAKRRARRTRREVRIGRPLPDRFAAGRILLTPPDHAPWPRRTKAASGCRDGKIR